MRLLVLLCLAFSYVSSFAGAGFYDSFAIANGTFYDLSAATGLDDLDGADLGTLDLTTGTLFLGGQSKTFKNNGSDVTGVAIFYRFYQGAASGAFTQINYSFQWNQGDSGAPGGLNNSGDQQWGTDVQGANGSDGAIDILNGATLSTGTYSLEVYMRVTTNGVDAATEIFDNNSSMNYIATFEVTSAMPVRFATVLASTVKDGNQLSFSTSSETNNSHFEIERITDSRQWHKLGSITGAGSTQTKQDYTFFDAQPALGLNYYRIKQVDFDGTFSYSQIVSANWADKPIITFYPNPVYDQIQINGLGSTEEEIMVEVLDLSGKIMLRQVWHQTNIDLQNVPAGLYILQLSTASGLLTQERIIVQ
ncbi:MAG: T9SS type A sorting domain-containing protein [Bacteroidota bacterium]